MTSVVERLVSRGWGEKQEGKALAKIWQHNVARSADLSPCSLATDRLTVATTVPSYSLLCDVGGQGNHSELACNALFLHPVT